MLHILVNQECNRCGFDRKIEVDSSVDADELRIKSEMGGWGHLRDRHLCPTCMKELFGKTTKPEKLTRDLAQILALRHGGRIMSEYDDNDIFIGSYLRVDLDG